MAKPTTDGEATGIYNRLPIGLVVYRLNSFLRGWANYFRTGYPKVPFREMDDYVRERMVKYLQRRSQRSYKPPKGRNWSQVIHDRLGVQKLSSLQRTRTP